MATRYGDRLRAAAKILKVTQVELAASCGVTQAAVSAWMRGLCLPETAQMIAVSRRLGLPVDYLIDDELEVDEGSLRLTQWIAAETRRLGLIEAYRRLSHGDHPGIEAHEKLASTGVEEIRRPALWRTPP